MFIKLSVIWFLIGVTAAQLTNQTWDLAVAINDQVEILSINGTVLGSAVQQFSKLKALTYDNIRQQFVVSDMDQENDTIYTLQLSKETDITPVVQDLPDDVQGLSIDTLKDILYWTDSINRTINYVSLSDENRKANILFSFKEDNPQDIAVDSCKRNLFWTNSNILKATIERSSLDGKNRVTLVNEDLDMPSGITLDQTAQRIYWADMRQGIYYRIESTDFDGKDRRVLHEGTHQKPFGIAVNGDFVYWTDTNNNALWRKNKTGAHREPELVRKFDEKPMGLVARNKGFSVEPDCNQLHVQATTNKAIDTKEALKEVDKCIDCLNGGELTADCKCVCRRGFTGLRCEASLCYNYCNNGDCALTSLGFPQCHCPLGFSGTRCEKDVCENFCLNDGSCTYNSNSTWGATCRCRDGFEGQRCEMNNRPSVSEICRLYCQNSPDDILIDKKNAFVCRCDKGSYTILEKSNFTKSDFLTQEGYMEYLKDPAFYAITASMLLMIVIIIGLGVSVCRLRKRPRTKKRIIVNKNVTPLTYRPQPPLEQCEITIENCCNMNVCETPCFDPPNLRNFQSKKDEKKTLLSNMENGDDLY